MTATYTISPVFADFPQPDFEPRKRNKEGMLDRVYDSGLITVSATNWVAGDYIPLTHPIKTLGLKKIAIYSTEALVDTGDSFLFGDNNLLMRMGCKLTTTGEIDNTDFYQIKQALTTIGTAMGNKMVRCTAFQGDPTYRSHLVVVGSEMQNDVPLTPYVQLILQPSTGYYADQNFYTRVFGWYLGEG